ncbi:MAG: hypothetical protein PHC78_12415, partial [Verrucomicrobiota bacterium]|nr:hypothetical protein [Verrucomicrobiota bacterium]
MMDWSWPPGSADVPVGSHFELVTGTSALPGVPARGRKPDAAGGHQARAEVRSTASHAAVRGLVAP